MTDQGIRYVLYFLDYSAMFATWGRDPRIGSFMMVLITMYSMLCLERNSCKIHLITPALVRECLGLKQRCSKKDVWDRVEQDMPLHVKKAKGPAGEDIRDAWILCRVLDCAVENGQ